MDITWKCYSPLRADFFPQEVYDDPYLMDREGPMELDGESLTDYADAICDAIQKENEDTGDLAQYIPGAHEAALNDKVLSILPSVEVVGDELMGCATVKLREPLDAAETAALREYLTGQYADGWGEGFEQREIEVSDGALFVRFWNSDRFGIEIDRHPQAKTELSKPETSAQHSVAQTPASRNADPRKYEITEISHPKYPWLHRIRALRDVGKDVHAGDLGGYVQTAENLTQECSCWLSGDAIACEDALVSQHARVSDQAVIRGSALVSGTAQVSGNAVVEDRAMVMAGTVGGDCFISGNAVLAGKRQNDEAPSVTGQAVVYGMVYGAVLVSGSSVILPGTKIDMPTPDVLEIRDGRTVLHRIRGKGRDISAPAAKMARNGGPER